MDIKETISKQALENYSNKEPWPNSDKWHKFTYKSIYKFVEKQLKRYSTSTSVILNAGSGGTNYPHKGNMIHLDIVDTYIKGFPDHIVASIDQIPLENSSVDIIICVGSVINYADYQRSLKEFSRILKPSGILILEFERSNSGEFLFNKKHHQQIFPQTYYYNNQKHILWMYNEHNIIDTLRLYELTTIHKYRFHTMSTLINRVGLSESKAAKYIKLDCILKPFSYGLSHNCILVSKKISDV